MDQKGTFQTLHSDLSPTTEWKTEGRPSTRNAGDSLMSQDTSPTHRREDRPVSRRGTKYRQGAVMDDRSYIPNTGRPMTASRGASARPPSASIYTARTTVVPGTASRLSTAMMQVPLSRSGTTMNLPGGQLNVVDRPITQQGLSGLRTGVRGPQMRQVQDKRYFEGVLQTKIRELTGEIGSLSKEIESQSREQSTFLVYDKRVKEMASELTELQGQLADYNLVVDKLNTDTEKGEIDLECQELKVRNNQEVTFIEQLFAQRQQKEAQIQQLEIEIEQEHHMTDNLLAAMSPQLREKYNELQNTNSQLQQEMEVLQQQLDTLTSRKTVLEDQLAVSQIKQEAVRLHHKLHEAEERRNTLIEEEKSRSTPAQERELLLQRVKDDNAEIATMERQTAELKDTIRKKQEDLEQTEQDLDESQTERHQKYRELRRREETMEQFLTSFEENKSQESARLEQLEAVIMEKLQIMSKNLSRSGQLPNVEDFSEMRDNLAFKEGELEKSKNTAEELVKEQQQLQNNLQKVEALEEKIKVEMESLRQRMASMTSEMGTLTDLDKLRDEAQEKRALLDEEREELLKRREPIAAILLEEQTKNEQLKKELNDNETYAQLNNLERKLAQLELNNFAMQEFIDSKKSETDYEPLKNKVYQIVQQYNTELKENLRRGVAP